jgi:hypothetical protein
MEILDNNSQNRFGYTSFHRTALAGAVLIAAMGLAACDGDDGRDGASGAAGAPGTNGSNGLDGQNGTPAFAPATILVASNGGGDSNVRVRNESLGLLNTYSSGANEGLLVDQAGHLVQAQDAVMPASIVTACNAVSRNSGDASRALSGASTGLVTPKGIAKIDSAGLVVVANVGGNNLLIFGAAAAGDQAPLATVSLGANAWDIVYDDTKDRLFVAQTNGSVAVFDDFSTDLGAMAPRIFTSSTAGATTNLHGIDYDPAGDRLVVSDVGSAADATDGRLYVFANASTATGSVTPSVTIFGPNTRLGNPVDLELVGSDVRIAEKSNDAILVYRNIFESAGGDLPADVAFATTKPESIAVLLNSEPVSGATDITGSTTAYSLLTTSNPGAGPAGLLFKTSRNVGTPVQTFNAASAATGLTGIENVVLDRNGDAYIAYNAGATPGIAVVSALNGRSGGGFDVSRDRTISGANTTLVTPKGVEIADDLGLILVSDTGVSGVLIFSSCAAGDVAPLATLPGTGTPWDSDYDPLNDTLYVAQTNGSVDAYDNFSVDLGSNGVSRTITLIPAATNLHGVRYDQRSDTLILSDVGLAADAADGALLALEFASTASGATAVTKRVAGPLTGLGNPVDIAFDGADLYVAEKANAGGAIQVWRNFLTDTSLTGSVAPSSSVATVNPESIVLMRKF